jgi:tetratricopeptide (TPR) repeat protein
VVVTDMASTLDIAPTILESLRIPQPAPGAGKTAMQGVSLLGAAARAQRVPARSLFLESIYPSASYGWATVRAIVQPSWKLIELPEPELYDMAGDPAETQNLHQTLTARVGEVKAEYDQLLAEVQSAATEAEAASIDDETRDRLISLGYIGGEQSVSTSRVGPDPKRMAFMTAPITIAMEFMRKKLWNDAIVLYTKVLEVDPDNRIALLQMARAQAASGRIDAAVPWFEHAIGTYPDVEEFYRAYGMAYLAAGRIDQAQSIFKTALAALPKSSHMHFLLGYARVMGRDWKGAAEELDLAARLGKRSSRPHYLLAICRLRLGDEPAALAALDEYLKLEPNADRILRDPAFAPLMGKPAFQELIKKYL